MEQMGETTRGERAPSRVIHVQPRDTNEDDMVNGDEIIIPEYEGSVLKLMEMNDGEIRNVTIDYTAALGMDSLGLVQVTSSPYLRVKKVDKGTTKIVLSINARNSGEFPVKVFAMTTGAERAIVTNIRVFVRGGDELGAGGKLEGL